MNPEHESQGALKAGLDLNAQAKIQVIGYRFLEDSTLDAVQRQRYEKDPELRKDFHVLDELQVAQKIWDCIGKIHKNVKVSLNNRS